MTFPFLESSMLFNRTITVQRFCGYPRRHWPRQAALRALPIPNRLLCERKCAFSPSGDYVPLRRTFFFLAFALLSPPFQGQQPVNMPPPPPHEKKIYLKHVLVIGQ